MNILDLPSDILLKISQYNNHEIYFLLTCKTLYSITKKVKPTKIPLKSIQRFELFKWVYKNIKQVNSEIINTIVQYNNYKLLDWAIQCGVEWSSITSIYAAQTLNLSILTHVINNGCKWHPKVILALIIDNNIKLLKWAIKNSCPWPPETTLYCINYYRFDMLKLCIKNGCQWNPYSLSHLVSINFDHKDDIIKWAVHNGCPLINT